MREHVEYLTRIRRLTQKFESLKGGIQIPAGFFFVVHAAKLLFASFDRSVVNNPSLMDRTGNFYWDFASTTTGILILPIQIIIQYWYTRKAGRVAPTWEKKTEALGYALAILGAFVLGIIMDYAPVASFSVLGLLFCAMWVHAILFHQEFRTWYTFAFLLQFTSLVAGPFIFTDLKENTLDYMRHVVGLCMLPGGCLLIASGLLMHRFLMSQLRPVINMEGTR